MIEHEKNSLNELKDIDDDSVEELSHSYPMLGRSAKKRILEKCLEKTEEAGFDPSGMTVSGTEVYSRPVWRRIAGTAAAAAAALVVVSGAMYFRKNILPPVKDPLSSVSTGNNENNTEENTDNINEEKYTEAVTTADVTKLFEAATTDVSNNTAVTSSYQTTISTAYTDTTAETTTTDETTTDAEGSTEATTETEAELTIEMLEGKWEAKMDGEERIFEFYGDIPGGKAINSSTGTGIAFSYETDGNTISFRFGSISEEPTIAVVERTDSEHMTFHWENGRDEELTRTDE